MRIAVRAFAGAREIVGARTAVEVSDGATVADVWASLCAEHPALGEFPVQALALNREYVPTSSPVSDGDEVAIIPPVSGG